ncbi:MAG: ABC transporter ATP-binding protein [Pseudomonadota bacterium]
MTPPGFVLDGSAFFGGVPVFENIALEAAAGQWTCLLGPSGVGKTTVLRHLASLEDSAGFDGRIAASDGGTLPGRIAYMAQSDLLMPWLDVRSNIRLGPRLRREPVDDAQVERLIDRVGLSDHATKRPGALSGGMRQRVALARTLLEDRPVVLLDEPFSALDARTRAEMQELAAELLFGRTVMMITHDPAEAARLGHRILMLTGQGLTEMAPPSSDPIRDYDDPQVFACQATLMDIIRRAA